MQHPGREKVQEPTAQGRTRTKQQVVVRVWSQRKAQRDRPSIPVRRI